ncbi:nuclear factor related to kappa-B-binding protein isoform X2 [Daktulosphaira vitifoliae]|uniref:nuclear factor related to kappa-B-binding protein isoform X2 n=1 Tax=Daktulosphaira vitifoliae TaxID=58002 RepID=UPI0021AA6A18|nr:nuclear factor related to kappa-B-binding protein isoform X2 [Daktulosphaira vitifoliae]
MSSYDDYQHWPHASTSNADEDELSSPEIEQDDSDDDTETSTSSTSSSETSSSSSSSQSGSDSESTSTADEDECRLLKTETAIANKTELSLPAGMCDEGEVFKQLFSVNSWVCLSDQQKQHLKNFLPTFSENDLMEKEITLRMLFGGQSFRFGVNPIDDFHDKLKNGHFRPDIVKLKSLLRRSLKREYRKNQRIYSYNMLKKLLSGRKKIIDELNEYPTMSAINVGGTNSYTTHQQVKRRYFRELADIKHQVGDESGDSSDSNYQEGPPARLSKKQQRHLDVVKNSLLPELDIITSTMATYPHGIDLSKVALPMSNPFDPTEDMYRDMLISHKRKLKKKEQEQKELSLQQFAAKSFVKPTLLVQEKKRSAANERSRVKRTKIPKQPPAPPTIKLDEVNTSHVSKRPSSENLKIDINNAPIYKLEFDKKSQAKQLCSLTPPSPPPLSLPLLPPPSLPPVLETKKEELMVENINAIKLETCINTNRNCNLEKVEEKVSKPIKIESVNLTADEIRKAEEGQAAAAMLLEQMSDAEEKYNPPISPSSTEKITEPKFSPSNYSMKREFHPEDMLTTTVQSINTESPPRILQSCMQALTPNNYNSKQLSLSPVSTPSKVVTDSNYVGSLSELEGFHVLDIKSECNDDLGIKRLPEVQNLTVSFFTLIRDIICSNWEYRMNMGVLIERVQDWATSLMTNSKNPLWFHCLAQKSWPKALQSAIGFLAGHFPEWQPEDFVPFIEYKPNLDTYQWIGAGRDSDSRLGELCKCWLHNLNNISLKLKASKEDNNLKISPVTTITDIPLIEMSDTDSSLSLPTPLLDTWIVTPSNSEERADFQSQERQRFLKPHRSFVYRMHGYESIVGPVRGIYNSSNIHKAARGHSLLIENRPHFISILVLVRDATARLPNGMGTRSDICTLLKDSQYLMDVNQTELHNAVSGALDRLHYEHDPCVKYDPKRKIWIYLHRGRSMEEFERLHLEQQGAVKMKCWRRNKPVKKSPDLKTSLTNHKLVSDAVESLAILNLPSNTTKDSVQSSSSSPVLPDMNISVAEEVIGHSEEINQHLVKHSKIIRSRKVPVQTMQMSDNVAININVECPSTTSQSKIETPQIFSMTTTSGISTITTKNKSSVVSTNISNVSNQFVTTNSPLKVVNTQTVVLNNSHMININQAANNTNQTFVHNGQIVTHSIPNKHVLSSGDLIAITPRKKNLRNVQIAQSVSIAPTTGSLNNQNDPLSINKTLQSKELQRQILVLKQKRTDQAIQSSSELTTVMTSQSSQPEVGLKQPIQQLLQIQQQQKMHKQQQVQLKILQRKQLQQQMLQQNKQQVIIRKPDLDNKTEDIESEQPQVIFVKQSVRGVQSEAQQITQQQLQQLLMMRPQQQTGQQTQVVMVKQPGNEQKPIALKPILSSLHGAKIQQSTTKTSNVLLQTKPSGQTLQRRIAKPLVGKLLSNPRGQLPVDSVLANRKLPGVAQGTPLRISGVQTSKGIPPQYTVVTVAQPRLMSANQITIGQQTPTRLASINERLKSSIDSNQPQTVRVVQSQLSGKSLLVTNKGQLTSPITSIATSSSLVNSNVASSTANTYTVLQQGSQQILVPASSLKSIQGLKVIPLTQHGLKGRSQMFARIVNPDNVRPVFIQQSLNQDTGQGSSEPNSLNK